MEEDENHPMEVIVAGAGGRMGSTLLSLLPDRENLELVGALEYEGSELVGEPVQEIEESISPKLTIQSNPESVANKGAVLIDFTRPDATSRFLDIAANHEVKMVIGTTGLSDDDHNKIEQTSEQTAIVQAPNMSVGINLLIDIVKEATRCLGEDFDAEVLEMHHRHKEDAPSGTARLLADKIARTRKQSLEDVETTGREGFVGERSSDEIGVMALRGGDVVGDHTVMFAGEGERIELTHRASSRQTFARGALRAARFLRHHDRGLFSMKEVLGL
ncbi:MAG: 4-hydroxy-tetrahydrodipicolinate reductase [bacterium]